MKIIDLTTDYIKHVCYNNNSNKYEESCPQLFEHYYLFWSKRNYKTIIKEHNIVLSRNMILAILPIIEEKFFQQNIRLTDITIILFVGMGNTNGHAFKFHDKFVVWIPVETYTNKIDTEVFITHEIAHALHYENSPDFYFHNESEQKHIGRQLITEGVATYISKKVLSISDETALWGNYLDETSLVTWMEACDKQFSSLKTLIHENFNSTDDTLNIFYANDSNDILNFRSGYYVGLKLIEQIVGDKKLTLLQLLTIPRDEFDKKLLTLL